MQKIGFIIPHATARALRFVGRHNTVRRLAFTNNPTRNLHDVLGITRIEVRRGRKLIQAGEPGQRWDNYRELRNALKNRQYKLDGETLRVKI